jgi:hypothetical protein
MHQQGEGRGARILSNIANGNGESSAGLSAKNIKNNRLPQNATYNDVYASMQNNLGKRLKTGAPTHSSGDKQTPPPTGSINDNTQTQPRKNREAVAATRDCGTLSNQSNDTTNTRDTGCGVQAPAPTTPDTNIVSGNTIGIGSSAGPRVSRTISPFDPNGIDISPRDNGYELGTDKYVDRIPKFDNIYDNPVPEIKDDVPTPKFKRFV